jgi:hypothetical protein
MKERKKFFLITLLSLLIFCLLATGINTFAINSSIPEISGQVMKTITFTPEEAELYKAAMKVTLKEVEDDVKSQIFESENSDRVEFFKDQLEKIQETNVDELFKIQEDGSFKLEIIHHPIFSYKQAIRFFTTAGQNLVPQNIE